MTSEAVMDRLATMRARLGPPSPDLAEDLRRRRPDAIEDAGIRVARAQARYRRALDGETP